MSRISRLACCLPLLILFLPVLRAAPETSEPISTNAVERVGESGLPGPGVTTYEELRQAILKARTASTARIEKAVDQEKVREAWEIGKLIDTHVLQHKERADYAEQVLPKLANDLGMDRSELYRMLEFYRAYPIVVPARQLSWSQYQALLAVNDSKERDALAEKAVKEKWNRDKTREEVKKVKAGKSAVEKPGAPEKAEEPALLKAVSGKPGTYKIVKATVGPEVGKVVIDLGFSNYYKTSKDLRFKEGAIIESAPPFGGAGSAPSDLIRLSKRTAEDLYTYRASLVRVLDGDTIKVVVDLGFGVRSVQTLRLRGLDCPELVSREGKEAKEFVEKILGLSFPRKRESSSGSPIQAFGDDNKAIPVLIKTTKSDKYDRYLADVWVVGKDGSHLYLNNELLQKGLAVRVRD